MSKLTDDMPEAERVKNIKDYSESVEKVSSTYPTKSEVDKLVEDHLEPSEEMKHNTNMAIHGESFIRNGKAIDNDKIRFIGADIQKNGISCSDGVKFYGPNDSEEFEKDYGKGSTIHAELKDRFNIQAIFKAVDKMSAPLKRMIKKNLEMELGRELTDFEVEQILAFESQLQTISSKRTQKYKNPKLFFVSTPARKDNFFFRQFSNNEINSEDYIKLKNDKEIEMSCSGCKVDKLNDWHHEAPDLNEDLKRGIELSKIPRRTRPMSKADYDQMINRADRGKLKNTDYPDRTHFKKKENILSKVVKWWRR